MQPFKAFVLTALQKDRVGVALVTVMTQMWCKNQPAEMWRKLELTSATAGTLKSGLPALCRCISVSIRVLQINHWLPWINCLPAWS